MNRWSLVLLGMLASGAVSPAWAQYPQYYYPRPVSPYAYPGPSGPVRPAPEVTARFNCPPTPTPPPSVYYGPTYSSFYDPVLNPRPQPGPWDKERFPFTNGFFTYYYTPGYFRY